eukprot:jgi/Chrzof1/5186/Cz15g15100.t1
MLCQVVAYTLLIQWLLVTSRPCVRHILAGQGEEDPHKSLIPTCRASPCRGLNPGHPGGLVTPRPSGSYVCVCLFLCFIDQPYGTGAGAITLVNRGASLLHAVRAS